MRHNLIFMPSYKDSIRPLDDENRLLMYDALVDYAVDGIEPNLPPLLNALFLAFKPIIDNGISNYDAAVENGKKGGAPKGNQNARKYPKKKQPKTTQNNPDQPKTTKDVDVDVDKDVDVDVDVEVDVEKEADVEEEKDIGSAGPDSRSRPYKEVDVDIEKEKLSPARFRPPEELRDATPEEIEENNQKKVLALQKLRQEVNK